MPRIRTPPARQPGMACADRPSRFLRHRRRSGAPLSGGCGAVRRGAHLGGPARLGCAARARRPWCRHRALRHRPEPPPEGWEILGHGAGVQLVETEALSPRPDDEAIVLGADDVPEMLALVERNSPGRSARARTSSAAMSASVAKAGSWRWPASGCTPRAGPRSAPSRRMPSTADRDWRHGSCSTWRSTSRSRGDRALMHAAATNVGRHRRVRAARVHPARAHDLLGRPHPGATEAEPHATPAEYAGADASRAPTSVTERCAALGTLRAELNEAVSVRDGETRVCVGHARRSLR